MEGATIFFGGTGMQLVGPHGFVEKGKAQCDWWGEGDEHVFLLERMTVGCTK